LNFLITLPFTDEAKQESKMIQQYFVAAASRVGVALPNLHENGDIKKLKDEQLSTGTVSSSKQRLVVSSYKLLLHRWVGCYGALFADPPSSEVAG